VALLAGSKGCLGSDPVTATGKGRRLPIDMAIRRDTRIVTSAIVTPAEAASASTSSSPTYTRTILNWRSGREPGRRFALQSPMRLRFATISRSTDVARQASRDGICAGAKSPAFERYLGGGAKECGHQPAESHN